MCCSFTLRFTIDSNHLLLNFATHHFILPFVRFACEYLIRLFVFPLVPYNPHDFFNCLKDGRFAFWLKCSLVCRPEVQWKFYDMNTWYSCAHDDPVFKLDSLWSNLLIILSKVQRSLDFPVVWSLLCACANEMRRYVAQSCVNVTKSDFTENDLYHKSTSSMNFNLNPKVHRSRSHSFDLISSIVFNLCPIHFNMVIHAENLSFRWTHTTQNGPNSFGIGRHWPFEINLHYACKYIRRYFSVDKQYYNKYHIVTFSVREEKA